MATQVGVTAEHGLVWLLLGKTPRKQFAFDPQDAYALADCLDVAREAAKLQKLGPPLGLAYMMNVVSANGKVWLITDRVAEKIPVSRKGAEDLARMVRFKAGMAEHNLEIVVKGSN